MLNATIIMYSFAGFFLKKSHTVYDQTQGSGAVFSLTLRITLITQYFYFIFIFSQPIHFRHTRFLVDWSNFSPFCRTNFALVEPTVGVHQIPYYVSYGDIFDSSRLVVATCQIYFFFFFFCDGHFSLVHHQKINQALDSP